MTEAIKCCSFKCNVIRLYPETLLIFIILNVKHKAQSCPFAFMLAAAGGHLLRINAANAQPCHTLN